VSRDAFRQPRPRVVHVLGSAGPRGTAQVRIVDGLARGLGERFALEAWFVDEDGGARPALAEAGVKSRYLPAAEGSTLAGALRLARAFRESRPDLVHFHVGGRSRTTPARRLTRARLISHLHGTYSEDGSPARFAKFIDAADLVIATSHAVARDTGVDAVVIPPGVAVPLSGSAPDPEPMTIGTAGRLEPIKGISTLLEATALMAPHFPDLRLEIAGSGSERGALEALAAKRGIAERVSFLGWVADPIDLHRRWNAFAIPSTQEGFGLAALEAMSAGVPVVASAVGGLVELVEDGRSGFLVPPGDARSLSDRISRLLDDPDLRSTMAAAAAERARQFSDSAMAERTAAVYEELLAEPRRARINRRFHRASATHPRSRGE
jgi:glycosyltransferase involved in cell wall biosynthesis